jgi:hypothetical protein
VIFDEVSDSHLYDRSKRKTKSSFHVKNKQLKSSFCYFAHFAVRINYNSTNGEAAADSKLASNTLSYSKTKKKEEAKLSRKYVKSRSCLHIGENLNELHEKTISEIKLFSLFLFCNPTQSEC